MSDDSSASDYDSEYDESPERNERTGVLHHPNPAFQNFSQAVDRISHNVCHNNQNGDGNNPGGDLPFASQMFLTIPNMPKSQQNTYCPKFGQPVPQLSNMQPGANSLMAVCPIEGACTTEQPFTQGFISEFPQFGQLPTAIPQIHQNTGGETQNIFNPNDGQNSNNNAVDGEQREYFFTINNNSSQSSLSAVNKAPTSKKNKKKVKNVAKLTEKRSAVRNTTDKISACPRENRKSVVAEKKSVSFLGTIDIIGAGEMSRTRSGTIYSKINVVDSKKSKKSKKKISSRK